ncbi:MAG: N-acetyltransferase [Alphaproteobacteria bacterium]
MIHAARIRVARPQDARVMAALHGECGLSGWGHEAISGYLRTRVGFGLLGWPYTVGRSSRSIETAVGFLLCRLLPGDEAELLTVGVLGAARSQGIGSAMLRVGLREASRKGARQIFLEVAEDNDWARRMYERHGFVTLGRRKDYYQRPSGGAATALVLGRPLAAVNRR